VAHVVVGGAGNIGSHVLPHVARMPDVTTVTVIDRDRYETSNVRGQNICPSDVGQSKAQVQARRLRAIDRSLDVRPLHMPIEDLPLGWLRGDVILSCLDSRRGRMVLNQAASRLRIPWIDAGVDASGLARVQVFVPSDQAPCLECSWDGSDYALVEQEYPCQHESAPPRTGASSALGALAAAVQALECEKLLAADLQHALAGRDVLIDARHHRHYVTRYERNDACRMPDHAGWTVARHAIDLSSTTLSDLRAAACPNSDDAVRIGVAGQQFALTLTCERCRERSPAGHLHRGKRRSPGSCPSCGGSLAATGFDLREGLCPRELPAHIRNRSLAELGLLTGDVVTITTSDNEVHLELCGPVCPTEF
jgi:molybdopterin/thiamine biosynthesis adenylyltransferase